MHSTIPRERHLHSVPLPRRRKKHLKQNRRLFIESLEVRNLLAVVFWDGGGDGTNWTNRFNWSGDQLPGSTDDVEIEVASNPQIVLSSGSHSIHSLHSAEAFSIAG